MLGKKKLCTLKSLTPIIFFLGCFILTIFMTYHATKGRLDSDSASELMLARHLANKGRILSSEWFYSTELRVLNTQLVYAPLFKIFNDWSLIRFVGATILQGILVFSYWCFTHSLRIQTRYFWYTAGLLVLPTSPEYATATLIFSYYIPHLSIGFFLLSMFFSFQKSHTAFKKVILLTLFCLLSFGSGLGGIRQLLATQIPLLVVCFFLSCKPLSEALTRKERALAFLRRTEGRSLCIALLGVVCMGVGYLINANIFPNYFSFWDYNKAYIAPLDLSFLQTLLEGLLSFFGYKVGAPVFSAVGVLSIFAIFCFIATLYFAIFLYRRRERITCHSTAIASCFFLVSLGVNILVFITSQLYHPRYFILVTVFVAPLLALMLSNQSFSFSLPRLSKLLIASIFAVFILNSWYVAQSILPPKGTAPNHVVIDHNRDVSGVTAFLEENDYTFGYATFWNANAFTEITDGAIEVAAIIDLPTPHFHQWLTLKEYERKDYHTGKSFLLLSPSEEKEILESDLLAAGKKVYEDVNFIVYSYETNEKFAETLNYLPS